MSLVGTCTLAAMAQERPITKPVQPSQKAAGQSNSTSAVNTATPAPAPTPAPKGDEGGIAGVPANNDCASAQLIACDATGIAGDNLLATVDGPLNPPCSFGGAPINSDVWYKFVATEANATVSLCPQAGTLGDTLIAIYSGACGALTQVGCNDDFCALVSSATANGLTVGTTYLVQVGGWNATPQGSWTLGLDCFPSGAGTPDLCANAQTIVCGATGVTGGNLGATLDGPEFPTCSFGGAPINSDTWYKFVATQASATVSLCPQAGTLGDTLLAIYSGACGALTQVGCNDDSCGLVSQATANGLTVGQTYLVQVGGWNATPQGTWTLSLTCNAPCVVTCTDTEGEPDCGVPVDTVNGGCNSAPNVFTAITCDETVCGTSGAAGGTRDTDWYEITITQPSTLTWTVRAEFNVALAVLNGACPPTVLSAFVTGAPCTDLVASTGVQPAGTYRFFVAQSNFDDLPCGAKYTATLDTDAGACCSIIGDVDGDGDVDVDDLIGVILNWGSTCP